MKKYLFFLLTPLLLLANLDNNVVNQLKTIEQQEKTFLNTLRQIQTHIKEDQLKKIEFAKIQAENIQSIKYYKQRSVQFDLKLKSFLHFYSQTMNEVEKYQDERKKVLEALALKKRRNEVIAKINISDQRMYVYKADKLLYKWKISSGKKGHGTPRGRFKAISTVAKYHSRKYNNALMPYSVFFKSGYAIHGTNSVSRLGKPASHGCIRLRTSNAKKFYTLVKRVGRANTNITIIN